MNNRIQELADQAAKEVPGTWMNIPDEFCEKFADSLIREVIYDCMDSVRGDDDILRISMVAKHWGVKA